ncbi:MAG: transposase [Bacteroidales bacterium]|nr:transposase [Bacteroidales bacterium]
MDNYPISSRSLEKHYYIDGDQLGQQYKEYLSDFYTWHQLEHAEHWILFSHNLGEYLSIDETALSNGELYTIITNKKGKGKKGSLVAMINGTCSDKVIEVLKKIPISKRRRVKEVTLDMANSMNKIVRISFPKATQVIDRFHVQKLAYDALQEIRIKHRWEAIDQESEAIRTARYNQKTYEPVVLANGDTVKQLLARSRYLLFKSANKWTEKQKERAKILFAQYPDIEKAYSLTHSLRMIFTHNTDKNIALTKLAHWYNKVEDAGFASFRTIMNTIHDHYRGILNYFDNRSTNASAESFNAKLKAFRATLRGVKDIRFFLYRVAKIYA